MLYFVITSQHRYTIDQYLSAWAGALAEFIEVVPYETFFSRTSYHDGVFVFTDLERLTPADRNRAAACWTKLQASGQGVRLLNHPTHVMLRYELLRNLFEHGVNLSNVYRATEARWPARYPVYLRYADDHIAVTDLIESKEKLRQEISQLDLLGKSRDELLITEFIDTSDEQNVFRKYSAFIVGETVIPRHMFCDRQWMVKAPKVFDQELLDEEWIYLNDNPHEKQLRELFDLARIRFGRIDYSMFEGRMQVWEINTNPQIATAWDKEEKRRLRVQEFFVVKLERALRRLHRSIKRSKQKQNLIGLTQSLRNPAKWVRAHQH